jgi:hypothetical protein
MSPTGLNVLKRTGCTGKFKCPLKKTQRSCPGSRDLNWTGKGLNFAISPKILIKFSSVISQTLHETTDVYY